MQTSNLFGISQSQSNKTSKRMLNQNAVKFKLSELKTTQIRYEVIYKNLVRDLRKYYQQDFNQINILRRKKYDKNNYLEFLECYIKFTMKQVIEKLQVPVKDIVFSLGSLIYPKQMLKLLKDDSVAKIKVINIYNYLYKFSLERLQDFLNNESLMLLFVEYLKNNQFTRVH